MVDYSWCYSWIRNVGHHHPRSTGLVSVTKFAYINAHDSDNQIETIDPIFGVTEKSVVMFDARPELLGELRRVFMSMGVEVFYGLGASEIGSDPLLIFDVEGLKRSRVNGRYDYARKLLPDASLCVVLDGAAMTDTPQTPPLQQHDDAQTLLSAAGVNFIFYPDI